MQQSNEKYKIEFTGEQIIKHLNDSIGSGYLHFLMFPHKNDKDSQCRQIVLEKKLCQILINIIDTCSSIFSLLYH